MGKGDVEDDEEAVSALEAAQKAREKGVSIGDGSLLFGALDSVRPELITIGKRTLIASKATILCHGSIEGWLPVKIGDNCHIGWGALILPGSVVGDNCVIGGRAVVTKAHPIPDNSVAVGNPAKVVKQRDPEELEGFIEHMNRWCEEG